jgi:predicted membrane chloride channel (bestrophin family)
VHSCHASLALCLCVLLHHRGCLSQLIPAIITLMHLQVLTELFDRCPISTKQRIKVDSCLTELNDVVGACERILRTPIPVSYTR